MTRAVVHAVVRFAFALALALVAGCHGCRGARSCPTPTANATLPLRLSETGLGDPGVLAYRPTFELWSDGATKRRWLLLPAGTRIDTSDMNAWSFPVGTKLWKEFSVAGHPVETRLLTRVGDKPSDWIGQAYVWNADRSEAFASPDGVENVHGTDHDVPSAGECRGCHEGRRSFVLGFSAIQLAHEATEGEVDLATAARSGLLSAAPAREITIPGRDIDRAALGYLHANCGHCHNRDRPDDACLPSPKSFDAWLRVDEPPPAHRAAPGGSLVKRMSGGFFTRRMPPLASKHVDTEGLALIRRWVEGKE